MKHNLVHTFPFANLWKSYCIFSTFSLWPYSQQTADNVKLINIYTFLRMIFHNCHFHMVFLFLSFLPKENISYKALFPLRIKISSCQSVVLLFTQINRIRKSKKEKKKNVKRKTHIYKLNVYIKLFCCI